MPKNTSKRWTKLVGSYKNEKNITTSDREILDSFELVLEYGHSKTIPEDVTPDLKIWTIQRTRVSPTLAYEKIKPGLLFNNWLSEQA